MSDELHFTGALLLVLVALLLKLWLWWRSKRLVTACMKPETALITLADSEDAVHFKVGMILDTPAGTRTVIATNKETGELWVKS